MSALPCIVKAMSGFLKIIVDYKIFMNDNYCKSIEKDSSVKKLYGCFRKRKFFFQTSVYYYIKCCLKDQFIHLKNHTFLTIWNFTDIKTCATVCWFDKLFKVIIYYCVFEKINFLNEIN